VGKTGQGIIPQNNSQQTSRCAAADLQECIVMGISWRYDLSAEEAASHPVSGDAASLASAEAVEAVTAKLKQRLDLDLIPQHQLLGI
jgi:hypothetical protein